MDAGVNAVAKASHTAEGDDVSVSNMNDKAEVSSFCLHRPKYSETEEVFEEALEGSIDDGLTASEDLKPSSNDAVADMSSDDVDTGYSGFSVGEGSMPVQYEGETKEDPKDIYVDAESHGKVKSALDEDDVVEVSVTNGYDKGGTKSEKFDNKDSNDGPQAVENGGHDERRVISEASFAVNKGTGSSEIIDEKSVNEPFHGENSNSVDATLTGVDDAEDSQSFVSDGSSAIRDDNVTDADQDKVHRPTSEVYKKLADKMTVVGSSEDQNGMPGHLKHACKDGFAFDVNKASRQSGCVESQNVTDRQVEQTPAFSLADQKETVNVKNENDDVASSGTCSENKDGGNVHSLAKEHVKEEKINSIEQNSQTSRKAPEIVPATSVGSSTARSANTFLPPTRPAGLGRAAPLLEPAPRAVQQVRSNGAVPTQSQSQIVEEAAKGEIEEVDETREKLQMIRVKFLRLALRLGQTPHNVVVAQVLYRLGLAEQLRGRTGGRAGAFSFDRAASMAEKLEQTGQEPLDFSCTIMVLGKTGVGKSATINSIFDEVKFSTDAFEMGTVKVQDVVGTVQGIRVRVIDTPGLLPSWSDQRKNEKILHSVKQFIKKNPPDIVLYLDRLDMPSRDFGDMPLLRTITDIFGPSIWFNAIVVLTHAASAPPEGPNGTSSTYDMFVTQRSHAVQQAIRQAAGDMRLMNPVSLVENHSACRTNRAGQRVLPNGQVWKPHLLLLSFASKILAEANTLLKLQDTPSGKAFPPRTRAPPLPFLLSSLLQTRPQLKLPDEQYDDDDDPLDDDVDEYSDSDEESEYDELPPFRSLTKAQLQKLSKEQRKAYYDELDYREKLLMKRQLKEEKKRRKMMKKMAEAAKDIPGGELGENVEEENNGAAALPVPMPDLPLPASFDADNPTHRYRCLDTSNQWLVRPVPDANGWDHDVGYDLMMVERTFVVKNKVPVSLSGQISKDKKEANLQMELTSSVKHGVGKATTAGFDLQSVGRDMAYTLRSETRFSNHRHNKATAGISMTLLGDSLTGGVKIEDKLIAGKQFRLVVIGGAMAGREDVAYGGSLEATWRDKDPLGRFLSSLGLSIMDWHGDLAIGCNLQSQIPIGRYSNLVARANINNRGSGQVSLRLNSSEHIQLALLGLIPLIKKIMGHSQQYAYGH